MSKYLNSATSAVHWNYSAVRGITGLYISAELALQFWMLCSRFLQYIHQYTMDMGSVIARARTT